MKVPEQARAVTFHRLAKGFSSPTKLWDWIRDSLVTNEVSGFDMYLLYLIDEQRMLSEILPIMNKNAWKHICYVRKKGPMYFLNLLPEDVESREYLLELLTDDGWSRNNILELFLDGLST